MKSVSELTAANSELKRSWDSGKVRFGPCARLTENGLDGKKNWLGGKIAQSYLLGYCWCRENVFSSLIRLDGTRGRQALLGLECGKLRWEHSILKIKMKITCLRCIKIQFSRIGTAEKGDSKKEMD
jgi:hypothetical protein